LSPAIVKYNKCQEKEEFGGNMFCILFFRQFLKPVKPTGQLALKQGSAQQANFLRDFAAAR